MICPASVLHNWQREAKRFTPELKVLVLESGAARHNLRKQIPQHDLIVTNYALLRRDLEELRSSAFRAVILDEAQFIKNPDAPVTASVQAAAGRAPPGAHRHAAGEPALDLWSIVDFVQPGYLGNRATVRRHLRRARGAAASRGARLSAKLRPCCCAGSRSTSRRICPTASRSAATASSATSSASFTWPNCAAAASR